MLSGVTVTVLRPNKTGTDSLNNPIYGRPTREVVDDVLIAPSTTEDLEAARQMGVTLALSLHFPKTYTASLRGCKVKLPAPYADTYHVVGDPMPYMAENCPTRWNRSVGVEVAHG